MRASVALRVILAGACLLLAAYALQRPSLPQQSPPVDQPQGYTPDPEGVRRFLDGLPQPYFAEAGAECMEKFSGQDRFLFRALYKAHQDRYGTPFTVGRQLIGDCVSWGAMHAVWVAESVDYELGKRSEPPVAPSTEAIYGGSRVEARGKDGSGARPVGGFSDGSTGWGAAKFLSDWGVVYRIPYPDLGYDLTHYDSKKAKAWGAYGCGGEGDGGKLDELAKKHPCKHVVQVKTWDELCAAIDSGYPVTIASSQGFSSQRDEHGFARGQGTWMHQMMVLGTRFQANGSPKDGALILNSWGPSWISGPRWPEDQPEGSFWCTKETMQRILGQDDSYAVGSVDGFKHRDLNNANWLMPAPTE